MSSRVYIGQLSSHARESDVERFFKGFGRIRELVLKNGYGFVEFEDYQDADDAVYELNDREICGERVRIEHARGKPRERDFRRERFPPRRGRGGGGGGAGGGGGGGGGGRDKYGPPSRTEYRLIVENLSSRVSWQDLKDHMRQAGEVTYADANKQRMNEGIVEFATYHDMKSALDKLDDSDINGRRVRLIEDKPRKRRRSRSSSDSRSRSRSRSRGRKRSRSRSRDRSRSRSRSRGRDRSRSRSRSRSRGRDRSRSRSLSRGRDRSRSRSRNRSRSRSRKRSRSSSSSGKKGSKSRSRSRTRTPEKMSPGKPEANGTPPSDG